MEYLYNEQRFRKMNLFWYGIDRSHCGSCWTSDDEELHMLFTDLTLDEMKQKLQEYLDKITQKTWGLTEFKFDNYLRWVAEQAELYEEDDGTPYLDYKAMYFEINGKCYAPDLDSEYNRMFDVSWDTETSLDPVKVLDEGLWASYCEKFEEIKKFRAEKKKKDEEITNRAWDLVRKYQKERKEYLHLMDMKNRLGGTKKIPLPKKPSFKEWEDNLTASMKALIKVMGERHLLGHAIQEIKDDIL